MKFEERLSNSSKVSDFNSASRCFYPDLGVSLNWNWPHWIITSSGRILAKFEKMANQLFVYFYKCVYFFLQIFHSYLESLVETCVKIVIWNHITTSRRGKLYHLSNFKCYFHQEKRDWIVLEDVDRDQ